MAKIKIEADELISEFKSFGENVNSNLGLAMHQACLAVVKAAKRRAPVDDGLLRASISHRVIEQDGEISGQVGTNVHYAIHVEYGHRTQLGKGKNATAFRVSTFSDALKRKKKRKGDDGEMHSYRPKRKATGSRMAIAYVPGRFFLSEGLKDREETVKRILTNAVKGAWKG